MKLTGRDGVLRIYDSSDIIAHGAQANMSVFVYDAALVTYTDKTAEAYADDLLYTGSFLVAAGDKIYLGCSEKFARGKFLPNVAAVGTGALVAKYFNGTSFVDLPGVADGTASGGDCFAQEGVISFQIPRDWQKGGGGDLSATMYYIELSATTAPTTAPDANILAPVDGQFFEVAFSAMDFSGPIGRPKTEEMLVLNRDRVDANTHYIEGSDDALYDPIEISFSCGLDDTALKDYIFAALACGNPNVGQWTAAGVSSKGDTKNDGVNANPPFADSSKKSVNVQILWTGDNPIGYAYYEVFFPEDEQQIAESEEAVTLSCKGGGYGVIERIYGFGVRY